MADEHDSARTPDPPSSLPRPVTSFLGRRQELADLIEQLTEPDCRLVTLAGPGGIGKTRLAIEAARRLAPAFADGVGFVRLQPVTPENIESVIADALEVRLSAESGPAEQLAAALGGREYLLVLDNFDHLLDRADLLSQLLESAPRLRCIVTSREVLNLAEEWRYEMHGLPWRADSGLPVAQQLFVERARRARSDFDPIRERAATDDVCELVEGMPLAIELAATWARSMNGSDIAKEIRRGTRFLATGLRNIPPEHRSMTAVFDHSWELLSEHEQGVFIRLCHFRGSFTREAARAIAGSTLDDLSALVDKSLVRLRTDGRHDIHELLRQYGAARLDEADEAASVREAHARWFLGLLDRVYANGPLTVTIESSRLLDAEIDNLRLAWQWATENADPAATPRRVIAFCEYCDSSGRYRDGLSVGRSIAERHASVPAADNEPTRLAIAGDLAIGWLSLRIGDTETSTRAFRAVSERHRAAGIPRLAGCTSDPDLGLGFVALTRGEPELAATLGQRALATAEREDCFDNLHYAQFVVGRAAAVSGDFEQAMAWFGRALDSSLAGGDRWFRAYIENELGTIAVARGDLELARAHLEVSYEIRSSFSDPEGMALALAHLGEIDLLQGNRYGAAQNYRRSLALNRDAGDRGGIARATAGLGRVAAQSGSSDIAAEYLREALDIACSIQYIPLGLEICVAIGELLASLPATGSRAVETLAIATTHPGGEEITRLRAREALTNLLPSPSAREQALETSQTADLDALVATLRTELYALEKGRSGTNIEEVTSAAGLTPREREVLDLLGRGLSNRQIADELVVSVGTVKAHTANIYGKLGVENRIRAVGRARELGLLIER